MHTDLSNSSSLSNLANWASILGFFLSLVGLFLSGYVLYVAQGIAETQRRYRFFIRSPKLLTELRSHSSYLPSLLKNFNESRNEIQETLSRCLAVLKNLEKKLNRNERRDVHKLIRFMTRYERLSIKKMIRFDFNSPTTTKDDVWYIYQSIIVISEELRHLRSDYSLEDNA